MSDFGSHHGPQGQSWTILKELCMYVYVCWFAFVIVFGFVFDKIKFMITNVYNLPHSFDDHIPVLKQLLTYYTFQHRYPGNKDKNEDENCKYIILIGIQYRLQIFNMKRTSLVGGCKRKRSSNVVELKSLVCIVRKFKNTSFC